MIYRILIIMKSDNGNLSSKVIEFSSYSGVDAALTELTKRVNSQESCIVEVVKLFQINNTGGYYVNNN